MCVCVCVYVHRGNTREHEGNTQEHKGSTKETQTNTTGTPGNTKGAHREWWGSQICIFKFILHARCPVVLPKQHFTRGRTRARFTSATAGNACAHGEEELVGHSVGRVLVDGHECGGNRRTQGKQLRAGSRATLAPPPIARSEASALQATEEDFPKVRDGIGVREGAAPGLALGTDAPTHCDPAGVGTNANIVGNAADCFDAVSLAQPMRDRMHRQAGCLPG